MSAAHHVVSIDERPRPALRMTMKQARAAGGFLRRLEKDPDAEPSAYNRKFVEYMLHKKRLLAAWQEKAEGEQFPARVYLLFKFRPPESKWSRLGSDHQQRPDLDNLIKTVLDALCPDGDHHVCQIHAEKIWAAQDGILIKTIQKGR